MFYKYCLKIEHILPSFQATTTLKATVLHFACFSAKKDEECLRMIKLLTSKKELLDNQLILRKNSDGLTAVCSAAQRSFPESVKHLLTLYPQSECDNSCDIELEYGVRSNNVTILDEIYQKHKSHYACQNIQKKSNFKEVKINPKNSSKSYDSV